MRLMVVDDNIILREGMIRMLKAAGHHVVAGCGDGRTAVKWALGLKPEAVLMDICMPVMDGLEALKLIKARAPMIKVVMLTNTKEERFVIQALQIGADGFMTKNTRPDEFIDSLKGLETGELALNRAMAERVAQEKLAREMEETENNLWSLPWLEGNTA